MPFKTLESAPPVGVVCGHEIEDFSVLQTVIGDARDLLVLVEINRQDMLVGDALILKGILRSDFWVM